MSKDVLLLLALLELAPLVLLELVPLVLLELASLASLLQLARARHTNGIEAPLIMPSSFHLRHDDNMSWAGAADNSEQPAPRAASPRVRQRTRVPKQRQPKAAAASLMAKEQQWRGERGCRQPAAEGTAYAAGLSWSITGIADRTRCSWLGSMSAYMISGCSPPARQ